MRHEKWDDRRRHNVMRNEIKEEIFFIEHLSFHALVIYSWSTPNHLEWFLFLLSSSWPLISLLSIFVLSFLFAHSMIVSTTILKWDLKIFLCILAGALKDFRAFVMFDEMELKRFSFFDPLVLFLLLMGFS